MAMPEVSHRRRWTVREVRRLIEQNPLLTPRYELVDGELLVTPSPAGRHQLIVTQLLVALAQYVSAQQIGEALTSPSDVELEDESLTQPDIYVVSREEARRLIAPGFWPARSLLLAVEVLSPSSARYDRVTKRPLYQQHVPDYWIVDVEARVIERWRTGDDRPAIVDDALTWHPAAAAEPFLLPLVDLFAKLDI